MANRIKKKEETKSSYQDNVALIMGVFTLIVLCVLPLVFHDFYFDILETKYQFYSVVAIAALVIMGGYGLASGKMIEWFSKFNFQTWRKTMNVCDWAMLAFWFCNVLSWIFCKDWKWEAFWGTSGRYNGVFLMTVYMASYFLVTRFFKLKQWYLDAFLAVGIFVCIFGITDYFQMDILGFKVNMMDEQKAIYTSTFGNINTYTIYVAALLAISMILFTQEKNQKRMLWYFGNMVLSSFALIMGTSDNAYLSLAAIFGLAPLWLFRTKTGLRRYVISAATFVTVILCINGINQAYASSVLGIDSAFGLIAKQKFLPKCSNSRLTAGIHRHTFLRCILLHDCVLLLRLRSVRFSDKGKKTPLSMEGININPACYQTDHRQNTDQRSQHLITVIQKFFRSSSHCRLFLQISLYQKHGSVIVFLPDINQVFRLMVDICIRRSCSSAHKKICPIRNAHLIRNIRFPENISHLRLFFHIKCAKQLFPVPYCNHGNPS